MPDFVYKNKVYYNPVDFALDRIGGTWKMPILWRLSKNTMRFGELKKSLPHISDKVLSTQLKTLQAEGFIQRKLYASVPPKVEYAISKRGKNAIKVIVCLKAYGEELMKELDKEIRWKKDKSDTKGT
jgi:DNA-binding HxlR family transcriptional regulator